MGKTTAAKARARQQRNVQTVNVFNATYGQDESRLEMWQRLCRDVGVDEGRSIAQCKRELKGIYLNIGEFVHAINAGQPIPVFRSYKALQNNLLNNPMNKFPKGLAKQSPILRWMLVQL